ncbi:flagellar protein FlaG [Luminiphilus sp.]|nr:flagellar protein FlaG [Luminiphilus sp.]MDA8620006.1 flagellar protein FlaG [Luminiphilus sp.]
METIASTNGVPPADVQVSKASRSSKSIVNAEAHAKPELSQSTIPTVSVVEVAAEAAAGKVASLTTLASVTESIDDAVEVLNDALSRKHTSAQIRKDDQLNRFLITIKDKDSGEVVREIPAEALLKFARNLEELKGILFDETL